MFGVCIGMCVELFGVFDWCCVVLYDELWLFVCVVLWVWSCLFIMVVDDDDFMFSVFFGFFFVLELLECYVFVEYLLILCGFVVWYWCMFMMVMVEGVRWDVVV